MPGFPIQLGVEEGLLTLRELADAPEIQRARLTFSRLRQWAFIGVNGGKKLPTIMVGRVRYTTIERTLRFAVECGQTQHIDSSEIVFPKTINTLAETHRRQLEAILYPKKQSRKNLQ
jgi:hypothetical protein